MTGNLKVRYHSTVCLIFNCLEIFINGAHNYLCWSAGKCWDMFFATGASCRNSCLPSERETSGEELGDKPSRSSFLTLLHSLLRNSRPEPPIYVLTLCDHDCLVFLYLLISHNSIFCSFLLVLYYKYFPINPNMVRLHCLETFIKIMYFSL